jgi:hypothetical protein
VLPTPPACSSLLPEAWKLGVASADLLSNGGTLNDWIKFSDAQTGQLDKSNDHYVSGIGIIERCEARNAEAVKGATKKHIF